MRQLSTKQKPAERTPHTWCSGTSRSLTVNKPGSIQANPASGSYIDFVES